MCVFLHHISSHETRVRSRSVLQGASIQTLPLSDQCLTCHGVAPFVRQGVDGLKQLSSLGVTGQGELCAGVCAVLNHAHPGLVLANVKSPSQGCDEAADVLKVLSAHAP